MKTRDLLGIGLICATAAAAALLWLHSPSLETTARRALSTNAPITPCVWQSPWSDRRFRLVGWSQPMGGNIASNDREPLLGFRVGSPGTWRIAIRHQALFADVRADVNGTASQPLAQQSGYWSEDVIIPADGIVLIRFHVRDAVMHASDARYLGVPLLAVMACPRSGS